MKMTRKLNIGLDNWSGRYLAHLYYIVHLGRICLNLFTTLTLSSQSKCGIFASSALHAKLSLTSTEYYGNVELSF